jgi:hypothetical protein
MAVVALQGLLGGVAERRDYRFKAKRNPKTLQFIICLEKRSGQSIST